MAAIAIFFAAWAVILPFLIGMIADKHSEPAPAQPRVSERFLERSTNYDVGTLQTWVTRYPDAARWYGWPILFPLDLAFMVSVAGFCAFGSHVLAASLSAPPLWLCAVWILPALYLVFDLIEDAVLFSMLRWPGGISSGRVRAAKSVWLPKIATFGLSIVQTIALAGAAMVWAR